MKTSTDAYEKQQWNKATGQVYRLLATATFLAIILMTAASFSASAKGNSWNTTSKYAQADHQTNGETIIPSVLPKKYKRAPLLDGLQQVPANQHGKQVAPPVAKGGMVTAIKAMDEAGRVVYYAPMPPQTIQQVGNMVEARGLGRGLILWIRIDNDWKQMNQVR